MLNRLTAWLSSTLKKARKRRFLFTSIKGQIFIIFSVTLISLTALTLLNSWSLSDVKSRLLLGERYFGLLNSILEARRFEKNYLLDKNVDNLKEELYYLTQIDEVIDDLSDDIRQVAGDREFDDFLKNYIQYRQLISTHLQGREAILDSEEIRNGGKSMVDFAEQLLTRKKRKIHQAIDKISFLPYAFLAIFILPMILVIMLISQGLLRPLKLLRETTKRVAVGNYSPTEYRGLQTDEMSRLIWAFNRMAQELATNQESLLQAKKIAALGTFTAGIAHELNNPINNISLTAETLIENHLDELEPEARELIDDIIAQVDRAGDIVRNLLDFSRSENLKFEALTPRQVIDSTVSLVKNQFMMEGVRLIRDIPEDLPSIKGDLRSLQQVFMNLLLNAIQVSEEGAAILIRVSPGPLGFVRFEIEDNGPGIPPDLMEHIFDPFYTTKSVGQGVGLGLSVTFAIVKRHGGLIEAKSEADIGSTFSVYLPEATTTES